MKDHLSCTARNQIRYHMRATEEGIARKYGISVAMVRQIRADAQPNHPARLAAKARRGAVTSTPASPPGRVSTSGSVLRRRVIPAVDTQPPKGQLHVEGGADLPQPLA